MDSETAAGDTRPDLSDTDAGHRAFDGSRLLRWAAMALFAAQFVGLSGFAYFLYHRFSEGIDYALFTQAFSQIGNGHLNPYSTIAGYTYSHSHFELIMWPLSLLYAAVHTPFWLSMVQVLSLVGTNVATFVWITRLVVSRRLPAVQAQVVLVVVAVLLAIDPLVYFSAALDFHFEATATFFAVMAASSLWSERRGQAVVWAGLCLICGDVGGLYMVGLGVSAVLAGRSSRRTGLLLLVLGVVWIGLISSLGANKGSFTDQYAYLAGRAALPAGLGGATALLKGIATHPTRGLHEIRGRFSYIGHYLLPGGVIGLVSPYGFGVPVVVLLSSSLQQTPLFITQPFQHIAVVPFVLFGTVSLLTRLASGRVPGIRARRHAGTSATTVLRVVAAVAGLAVLGGAAYYAHDDLHTSLKANAAGTFIPSGEAYTLRSVLHHTPSDAEVIVSLPVSGRFAARRWVYLYDRPARAIPIESRTVVLVLDTVHTLQLASTAQDLAAVRYVQQHFGASTVGEGLDCVALEWTAPASIRSVVLP